MSLPWFAPGTLELVKEALEKQVQQGDGDYSLRLSRLLDSRHFEGFSNFLTPSCTASLEIVSLALGLQPGDEVITPSFNFTSGAISLSKFGVTPVFVDIDPLTGCIDADQVPDAISRRTKAISWVNYAGLTPNQGKLKEIAQRHNLTLIEDHAHGFGLMGKSSRYGIADFIVSSFHATKNFHCGEGGHIGVVDSEIANVVRVIREKGTNRSDYLKGLAKKYRWVGEGGSYLLPEVCSAILWGQIEHFEKVLERRRSIVARYHEIIVDAMQDLSGVKFLENLDETAHMYAFLLPDDQTRSSIIRNLLEIGIQAASHYEDLASSPHGKKVGRLATTNTKSLEFSKRIIRIPVYMNLTDSDVEFIATNVINSTLEFIQGV